MPFPTTTAEVTAEWLTENLRAAGTIGPDVTVTKAAPDNMAAGIGFMGEVGAIDITYDGDTDAPTRMVAKIPTTNQDVRAMLAPAQVFFREAKFYETVAPALGDLVPQAYFIGNDPDNDDFFLLIEDLGGNREGDQLTGANPDEARLLVESIATFHAAFWENDRLDDVDWMPPMDDPGMKVGEVVYASSIDGFKQVFSEAIDPACSDIIDRFGPNVPQLLDRMAAMPKTISHFDFRLDNIFFTPDGAVKFIDFQTCAKGGGIYDVGYLLSQSISVDDRRAHEAELLQLYHDTLVAEGVSGYSLDQIKHDYRIAVLYSWVIPVFAVGSLDVSSERAMALWTQVIIRAQEAMKDHDVSEFLIS